MRKWFFMFGIFFLVGCSMPIQEVNEEKKISYEQKEINTTKSEAESKGQTKEMPAVKAPIEEEHQDVIEAYIEEMTLEEKVGQLFMIALRQDANGQAVTILSDEEKQCIKAYHIGGVILFSENIEEKEQLKQLISDMQEASKCPLFIGVDEEGGQVSRIGKNKKINEVPFKEAYVLGSAKDTSAAYEEARRMGKLLHSVGINMDFAPVADIFNEPKNTVIGRRSFGKNSEVVTPMVLAFAKGLREEKIMPVVKHFPGHGNTREDSHSGLAYVNKKLPELEQEELVPFFAAINDGMDGLMKGHLLVSAVDDKHPASLSVKWQDYLRSKADTSNTLLITDALNMGAITAHYTSGEMAVLAVQAGNDILLMPENLPEAYEGLLLAVKEGKIAEERIDCSVKKILSKKIAQNLNVLS